MIKETEQIKAGKMPDDLAEGFIVGIEGEDYKSGEIEFRPAGEDIAFLKMSCRGIYENTDEQTISIRLKINDVETNDYHTFRWARHSFYRLISASNIIEFFMEEIRSRDLDAVCEALDFEMNCKYEFVRGAD